MSALTEKSLLLFMALTLGLIITWLIASDPVNSSQEVYGTHSIDRQST
ncbi:hypothetical protein [Methylomagnum ishizawai]|nr:hypothetical protein [Methylomagnum ishizawai]BBL74753.1 hypothetical protein MishRS11D_18510 [Methylomagnum ishizawai]